LPLRQTQIDAIAQVNVAGSSTPCASSSLLDQKRRNVFARAKRVKRPKAHEFPDELQTFDSLWTVWLLQLGQNFLIANFSVWRFLFFVVT
jgi:hypothetical protein